MSLTIAAEPASVGDDNEDDAEESAVVVDDRKRLLAEADRQSGLGAGIGGDDKEESCLLCETNSVAASCEAGGDLLELSETRYEAICSSHSTNFDSIRKSSVHNLIFLLSSSRYTSLIKQ